MVRSAPPPCPKKMKHPLDLNAFYAELAARPRLRGRLHQLATAAAAVGLVVLVRNANTTEARIGAWIYGLTSLGLYATSSSYHVFARSPRARRIMQRADHTMIYFLIAGSFTPIALLALDGPIRVIALGTMWLGAIIGMLVKMVWFNRFRRFGFALYLILGWAGLLAFPALRSHPKTLLFIAAGGILYTVGAVLFALQRPRWNSSWFGYHELWHTFGIAAGALLFAANLGLVSAS